MPVGLFAAGLTSAVTAPLAAAYVVLDTLGRGRETRSPLARVVWLGCILIGGVTAVLGTRPVALIFIAQIVNGLVLPIVAVVLLIAMNDRGRLGNQINGWRGNLIGAAVVLLCAVLGIRSIMLAF